MKKVSFDIYRKIQKPYSTAESARFETVKDNKKTAEVNTIQGILLNNHIKDKKQEDFDSFENISRQLLIPENYEPEKKEQPDKIKNSFDVKKALRPLAIATGISLGTIVTLSFFMKSYSKIMANKAGLVMPGDLARNINIVEEPHFAMYRALRDPNAKNILGLIGVGIMTATTVCAKNFVDGTKEIWIKKQNCDIEHDLQKNLIDVEAEAFSKKLKIVNNLLTDTTSYFKSVLGKNGDKDTNFKSFLNFKGKEKNEENEENKKSNTKLILGIIAATGGLVGLCFGLYKNFQKTAVNLDSFYKKFEDKKIRIEIENAVNEVDKKNAIEKLIAILKTINAKEQTMKDNLSKIKDITPDEIKSAVEEVKKAQIYAQAPEALGGISKKIQYYCYINEERGHLYNWILNPENDFNKYLFLSFCAISSTGYILRTVADAIKNVIVGRENSKSELNLRKQLVQVEVDNFKTKKMSAINPMLENFRYQAQKGKSKEELKELAENILTEIKNGPPYVYS